MITANDVLTVLCSNYDTTGYPQQELTALCSLGLSIIKGKLRSGVSSDNPLIAEAAAAFAHYYFVVRTLTEPEKYESYRVGDVSVTNNPSGVLQRETEVLERTLAAAHSILQDGGFGCYAY